MRAWSGWAAAAALVAGAGLAAAGVGGPPRGPTGTTAVAPGEATPPPQELEDFNPGYDGRFQFVRLRFDDGRGQRRGFFGRRREPEWAHDYPRAEHNFLRILDETTYVQPHMTGSNILAVDDPELFKHPIAYIVEVGFWNPSESEVRSLREYLEKGGFLIVDDFRSRGELRNFEFQIQRVIPGAQLIQLDATHQIFDSFFRIERLDLAPPTFRQYVPVYYGIFENNDQGERLLAIINHNNDIAEYWEFSDRGYYPIDLSNEAYKLGVNYIIYAMTH